MKQKHTNYLTLIRSGIRRPLLIMKLVLVAVILSTLQINATVLQQMTVTGIVKDETGQPMPGVNIQIEGTTSGTTTDVSGKYSINVPNATSVLKFTFIGYEDQSITVNGQSVIDVNMALTAQDLEQVVVVGYGTQKKKDVTSAIAVVDTKVLSKAPVANVQNALVGLTPGVEVQGNQGRPGEAASVRIRGVSSTGDTDPLYVVDGIPVGSQPNVNPNDIESMQVLKDAASAAIYGARGANGVIIITTKSGKKGTPKISYSGYYGWEKAWKQLDLLSIEQWAEVVYDGNTNAGSTVPPLAADIINHQEDHNYAIFDPDAPETDWQEEIFQTGTIMENNFDISGGTDAGNYYFSANQFKQDGIIIDTPYKRYSVRMNSNWQYKILKFGENLSFTYTQNEAEDTNGGRSTIEEMIKMTTNIPVRNPLAQGGFSGYDGTTVGHDASNPVGTLLRTSNINYGRLFRANFYGEIELIKGLTYRSTIGISNVDNNNRNFQLKTAMVPKPFENTTLSENHFWQWSWTWENMLTYHKIIGKNDITLMGAYTADEYRQHSFNAQNSGVETETNDLLGLFTGTPSVGGAESEASRYSYLGRLQYIFNGKYMLTANFRRDGNSKFSPGNKWGSFPSVSAAWRVSDEAFMKGIEQISNLKLKVSYGVVGNDAVAQPYNYISGLASQINYPINGTILNGVTVRSFNNPTLTWETVKQFDAGLELGLFKGAFELSGDYFWKRTEDMLIGVPIPGSSGSAQTILRNLGSILNTGVELQATVRKNIKGIDMSLTGNMTALHNEVDDLKGAAAIISGATEPGNATKTDVGHQIGAFFGYKSLGIFNDQAEIDAYTFEGDLIQPGAEPGDIKWADLNNDGVISSADRDYIGNPIPTLTYSFNANFAYKGFDLQLFFQGISGNDIFAELVMWTEGMHNNFNLGSKALDRWTPDNTNASVPRAIRNDPNGNITNVSDRYIKNGSYFRLKNASLGYTLPKSIVDYMKISNVRLYVTGRNIFTITKYPFYDPEIGSGAVGTTGANISRGIDNGYYPQARTIIMGIQVDF